MPHTSCSCDPPRSQLFDSWDEDKGGSLDMKALKTALLKTQGKAEAFNSRSASDPSIRQVRISMLINIDSH